MFEFALSFLISHENIKPNPYRPPEYIQRYCAKKVGIPYASDNFSEEEWYKFTDCVRKNLNYHDV
jgi:hypothetical protein